MKKNSIAKRVRSFKEDFMDVLSNFRSPTNNSGKLVNGKQTKPPRDESPQPKSVSSPTGDLVDNFAFNEQLTKELKNKFIQISCALRYIQDVAEKNKFEMLPGSATIILDLVSTMIMTLKNAIPPNVQSSVLISASAAVHQALANLVKWSDDVLLEAAANDSYENIAPKQDANTIVDSLKTTLHDLVQVVMEKATAKNTELSSETSATPTRLSKSSNDSAIDETRSSTWSSDSLAEDYDSFPPPKPPLPGRGLLGQNDTVAQYYEPSPPPPLPPKRRLNSPFASFPQPGIFAGFPNSTEGSFPTLPDLISHESLLTSNLNSMSITSSSHEVFHKEVKSYTEHQQSVTMATNSSTTFSSASFSSFSSSLQSRSTEDFLLDDNNLMFPIPPVLPLKRRQKGTIRTPSQYDNVDVVDGVMAEDMPVKEENTASSQFQYAEAQHMSAATSFISSTNNSSSSSSSTVQMRREFSSRMEHSQFISSFTAPPLPLKKRHIMAYMEMVGPYSQPLPIETYRQSVDVYNALSSDWQRKSENLFQARASSYIAPPPVLPPKKRLPALALPAREATPPEAEASGSTLLESGSDVDESLDGMEQLELLGDLVEAKTEGDGSEIRGGTVDALIIYATKPNDADFLYQEAFLATYRTFIKTDELIGKLVKRFYYFIRKMEVVHQRAAKNSFSLLVRVVDDLAASEVDSALLGQIMDFQNNLVSSGDLVLAKALRYKLLEKCTSKKRLESPPLLPNLNVSTKQNVLLDFKSGEIAEQMTVLDSELFYRIEVHEVLIWAQEQNEEKTANLNLFTEHFNNVSYWARSRILEQSDAKERERYVMKFIKIMKHLRRLNNFNSYLALLSALDSAPVRRLEWHKSITDGLEEYCALIDSSSSFRAYRQALAETQPPCIPYIGLILQDLTFVHIGNPDLLPEGKINFSKRWQQFHILDNMRRFQKCQYEIKRNEKIISFFHDFADSISEETMWSISESIKPRGSTNSKK